MRKEKWGQSRKCQLTTALCCDVALEQTLLCISTVTSATLSATIVFSAVKHYEFKISLSHCLESCGAIPF